jgi:hypothetical protein
MENIHREDSERPQRLVNSERQLPVRLQVDC